VLVDDVSGLCVTGSASVKDGAESHQISAVRLCLVVGADNTVLGIVSDGDIRRGLLAGAGLDSPATTVMNASFESAPSGTAVSELTLLARSREVTHLPLVDEEGKLVRLFIDQPDGEVAARDNTVVIMAGGMGLRLRPLTESTPKPMLPVGGKPMVQHTIESLRAEGFANFVLAINYLGDQIEEHFGDGSGLGVRITYVKEEQPLGTGGALSLLEGAFTSPIVVINGDVLLSARLTEMLNYHHSHSADITVGVKVLDTQIPFGVIELEGNHIVAMQEKPVYRDFVNAGVYVLEPPVVRSVAPEVRLDMPDLVVGWLGRRNVFAYPMHEPWRDLGHIEDLESARQDYERRSE
jgi:dTDP-glucose pyrophosphorylase/CBS domain-containing protein